MSTPITEALLAKGGPFEEAALRSDEVAERWQSLLTVADRQHLLVGFHLAESMAGIAIAQARAQIPERYHEGLDAQAGDEVRHIAVFERWLGREMAVPVPQARERQLPQWLALLLVNELTGFCQFRMLARMLESAEARSVVGDIAADERVHVARLLGWLEPLWSTRGARPVGQFITRFRRDLPGRMCQFFPRAELLPLRSEMVQVIDALLLRLPNE